MLNNYDVVVMTTDKYVWALEPFAYLFNKYWQPEQHVIVVGFSQPNFPLPYNFTFCSVAPEEYPKEKWSNALIRFLQTYSKNHFVLMLEDYWLYHPVDSRSIALLIHYAKNHPNVLRIDLTSDRDKSGRAKLIGKYIYYDIVETPKGSPYQISLQAGVWSRDLLLLELPENKSPWDWEIYSQPKSRVLGTKQYPVKYANAVLKGKIDYNQIALLSEEDRLVVMEMIKNND